TALGARRATLIRQLLTESLLLSLTGGAIGFGLSIWLTKLLVTISPVNTPRLENIGPDARVFAFTLALTVLTGFVFGLAPAVQASRIDVNSGLKESGRSGSGGVRNRRLRGLMMVSEIALSFMLLAGAGLLIKSFIRLREVSPGFEANNLLTLRLSLLPA